VIGLGKMNLEKAIKKHGTVRAIPISEPKYWDMLDMYMANCLRDVVGHPKNSTICFDFYDKVGDEFLAYKPLPKGVSVWDVAEEIPDFRAEEYNHE
jgi:hypothetical protein